MAISPARGMRDFPPREKERRDRVMGEIRQVYLRHGFEEIETPAIEDQASLHSGLGGDNEKLSFQILKRGLETADIQAAQAASELSDLGLRFDLTVPLARFYATHHAALPPVFRAFHQGPVWRAERPQKGRYRQFVQCDIDILGEASHLAEAEVLLATADALETIGLTGVTFRVNDRRLLGELLTAAGIDPADQPPALITLDKCDKIGAQGVRDELLERVGGGLDVSVLDPVFASADHPMDAAHIGSVMGGSSLAGAVATELVTWVGVVTESLPGARIVFDPTLVRGMGYYTGSIVEISHPGLGISIGGGGRYDGMIGRFLGRDHPAVGVSLGFERLLEVLPEPSLRQPNRVALILAADDPFERVLRVKKQLVETGHTVRLVPAAKNMRSVFERLEADGFSRVATLGEVQDASALAWRDIQS